jgi:hypothetical protein
VRLRNTPAKAVTKSGRPRRNDTAPPSPKKNKKWTTDRVLNAIKNNSRELAVEKIEGKKMDHLESILTKVAAAAAASNSLNGSGSLKRVWEGEFEGRVARVE